MLLVPNRSWRTASTKTQVAGERCRRDVRHSRGGGGLGERLSGTLASQPNPDPLSMSRALMAWKPGRMGRDPGEGEQ